MSKPAGRRSIFVLATVVAVLAFPAFADASATVTKFNDGITWAPGNITTGADGNIWFTPADGTSFAIGRITTDGVVTQFPTPDLGTDRFKSPDTPLDLSPGGDGNIWFTTYQGRIGRITPAGAVTVFNTPATPTATTGGSLPGITKGADGNIWFTYNEADEQGVGTAGIGRITPVGAVTTFTSGFAGAPERIAAGPDGNLWFTETDDNSGTETAAVGEITPAGKVVTNLSVAVSRNGCLGSGGDISVSSDGTVWFVETLSCSGIGSSSRLDSLNPSTGEFSYYWNKSFFGENPGNIATGPDGTLWTTGVNIGSVVYVTPGNNGGLVPNFDTNHGEAANDITSGPDGNLWVSASNYPDNSSGFIARISPVGAPPPVVARRGQQIEIDTKPFISYRRQHKQVRSQPCGKVRDPQPLCGISSAAAGGCGPLLGPLTITGRNQNNKKVTWKDAHPQGFTALTKHWWWKGTITIRWSGHKVTVDVPSSHFEPTLGPKRDRITVGCHGILYHPTYFKFNGANAEYPQTVDLGGKTYMLITPKLAYDNLFHKYVSRIDSETHIAFWNDNGTRHWMYTLGHCTSEFCVGIDINTGHVIIEQLKDHLIVLVGAVSTAATCWKKIPGLSGPATAVKAAVVAWCGAAGAANKFFGWIDIPPGL